MGIRRVGRSTLHKLRSLYRERWKREWPENDEYLARLWREARDKVPEGHYRVLPKAVFDCALDLMRECHPFTP